ncbi:MAG: glycosyltransferase [Pseudomonadota bacterium]
MSIDIIIPYFQRTPGILKEAVRSVMAQTVTDWHLIIIDDGSPYPAKNELDEFSDCELASIRIIEQPNGGVSAARNRGLENVRPDARFVAFLDSDDFWSKEHLQTAVTALDLGADMFWGQVATDGSFDTDSAPSDIVPPDQRNSTIESGTYLSQHLPRMLVGEWWRHMHLSATVMRAELAARIRFDTKLRSTEDFDFFRRAAALSPTVCFSDHVSVTRGVADNIWHNLEFEDPRVAQERYNTFQQLTLLTELPGLSDHDHAVLQWRRNVAREQFIWTQFNRRAKGDPIQFNLIFKWLMMDPGLLQTVYRLKTKPNDTAQIAGIPKREELT